MIQTRIIPVLLLQGKGLVKGAGFKDHRYVGDPLNAIRIYNKREADELVLLDISATKENRSISVEWVELLSKECTMPFSVGGGIDNLETVRALLRAGAEKVCIGSAAVARPELISEISKEFGAQCALISIDCRKAMRGGYEVVSECGTRPAGLDPVEWAVECERRGAGEILLTSIEQEGSQQGYDLELVREVSSRVSVPVIANGGAGNLDHMGRVVHEGGASAAAAGSLFVFQGSRRAVLISYPSRAEIEKRFFVSSASLRKTG